MSELNRKRSRSPTKDEKYEKILQEEEEEEEKRQEEEKEEEEEEEEDVKLPIQSYEERQVFIRRKLRKYRKISEAPGWRTKEECDKQRECLKQIARSIPPDPSPAPHPLLTQAQAVLQEHLGVSLEDVINAVQEHRGLPHGRCFNHRVDTETGFTECFVPNPLQHDVKNTPFCWRPSVEEENGKPMDPIYDP
jgi:hypothetical protein